MLYSAITGKGIPDPGPNSLLQFRVQFKLRGLIGAAFVFLGVLIAAGIFKLF
jgi:hypothetical protein